MKNQITRHVPAFVETGDPVKIGQFENLAGLLSIPWVESWNTHKDFHQFSVTRDGDMPELLIAEFDKEHWVIGYLKSLDGLEELPTFVPRG